MESSKLKVQSSKEAPWGEVQAPGADGGALILSESDGVWRQVEQEAEKEVEREMMDDPVVREDAPGGEGKRVWDLEERLSQFGERIVRFSKRIPRDPTNVRLISQLVGAGTSTGANYCEANEAVSVKDFKNTIGRCLKEAKETKFFLRMVAASEPALAEQARALYREAHELLRVFGAMRKRGG